MKILVTGANGFLGSGVVKQLLDNGNTVIATDLSVERIDDRAKKIACNLFEQQSPFEFFEKPDIVLHMAWRDGFVHNSDKHIFDLPCHYEFLKKMVEARIKRVAVIGTMHEIGFYEGAVNEDTPCRPMSLYGAAKNTLRDVVSQISKQHQVDFQWLRVYYIVANTVYGNSLFSKIVAAAQRGDKIFPFTTGQNQYDFLDYDEFCKQVAAAVQQDEVLGIINICSGKPEKLADRVERFIEENKLGIELEYGKFPDRPYDSKAIWADSEKINQIISAQKKF